MPIEELVQLDTNIDDVDPRLLPRAIDRLLAMGALDAWVTPIVMKKGRPAFALSALCRPADAVAVRDTIFRETSTIGIRETLVTRHSLDRRLATVEVDGHHIGVKIASSEGSVVNVSVEWDDVVRAADATGATAADFLDRATAAARELI